MAANTTTLKQIEVASLYIEPGFNIRPEAEEMEGVEDLAASIVAVGLQTPMIVKPVGDRYQILSGHRRFRAIEFANTVLEAGIKRVQAVVKTKLSPEEEILAMLGDAQARRLSPLGVAEAVKRLSNIAGLTNAEIARKFGISAAYVGDLLELAHADKEVKEAVQAGDISPTTVIETLKKEGEQAPELIKEAVADAKKEGKKATAKTVERVKNKVGGQSVPTKPKTDFKALLQSAVDVLDTLAAELAKKDGKPDLSSVRWVLREAASHGVKAPNNAAKVTSDTPDSQL